MQSRFVILFILLISVVSSQYQKKGKNTLILNTENFEQAISEFENLFVMFYYGYLYHKFIYFRLDEQNTEKLKEDYVKVNEATYEEFDKLALEFLDETEAQEVAIGIFDGRQENSGVLTSKYMVSGFMYPVIQLFSRHIEDIKGIMYKDPKKKDKMLSFLNDKLIIEGEFIGAKDGVYFQKNGVVELNTVDYQQAVAEYEFICVQYYKLDPKCKKCQVYPQKWKRVSMDLKKTYKEIALTANINCDNYEDLCKDYDEFPALILLQNGKSIGRHSGNQSFNNLFKFCHDKIQSLAKKNDL